MDGRWLGSRRDQHLKRKKRRKEESEGLNEMLELQTKRREGVERGGGSPVPRKVCQKQTENLSHSSIVLPITTWSGEANKAVETAHAN